LRNILEGGHLEHEDKNNINVIIEKIFLGCEVRGLS
jgi:hypothetical protein